MHLMAPISRRWYERSVAGVSAVPTLGLQWFHALPLGQVRSNIRVLLPPPVPDLHPLLEQGNVLFVDHAAPPTT